MKFVGFDAAPIMAEVPERCESCTTDYLALRPICRMEDGALRTVGYFCTMCNGIHLYRETI